MYEQSVAKFEYKGVKTVGVTDYTNYAPQKCCGQTDGQTDGRSGPTTRPAFAKATQVKNKLAIKHTLAIKLKENVTM